MAAPVRFESARVKEIERQQIKEAREKILEKAKADYEKDQRRKEKAKERGEDVWMLPSVNARIENESKSLKKKKKKEKKKHKKKKSRKRDDNSSDSDDETAWVEKTPEVPPPGDQPIKGPLLPTKGPQLPQRDDWMMAPSEILPTITRDEIRKEKERQKEEENKKNAPPELGQHHLELNPYWKEGGTGLPEEKPDSKKGMDSSSVDFGLSWLKQSHERFTKLAKEEGKTLEEVAAERFGSLQELERKIEEAEEKLAEKREKERGQNRDRYMSSRKHQERSRDSDRYRRSRSRSRERDRRGKPRHRHSRSTSRERRRRSRSTSRERRRHSRSRSRDRHRRSRSASREKKYRRSRSRDRSPKLLQDKKRLFMKPTDNDSAPSEIPQKKRMFMKPGESSESSSIRSSSSRPGQSSVPAWKKKSALPQEPKPEANESSDSNRENKSRKPSVSSASSSPSESSSEEEEEQEEAPVLLTEQQMNEIGAKIVKAEIMGNTAMAEKLKDQLEKARKAKTEMAKNPKKATPEETEEDMEVVLTRTSRGGLVRPLPEKKHPTEAKGGRRKKKKVDTHGTTGDRKQYFDDDSKYDLKSLVERERMGTAEDQNMMFARLAGRSMDKTNDDYQVDDVFMDRASKKQSDSQIEERERALAIHEHRKQSEALKSCTFCFNKIPKHLLIAIGTKVYLSLPNHRSMTEGHCLIVPMQHVTAGTVVDEDVWQEIQTFRKCLTKMFAERDEDCVFMETAMYLKKQPHMCIEVVPCAKEVGDMAPIYFKKAIQETGSEWAQNKKLIELKGRPVKNAVPKGFPYFTVDFGLDSGFAHVIEEEQTFPRYFGREIVGGMLDLDPGFWRKPKKESFEEQRKKVLQFSEMWKPYDWTQKLA